MPCQIVSSFAYSFECISSKAQVTTAARLTSILKKTHLMLALL